MKGIVFNLLEEVVTNQLGPDVWDDLLDQAALTGAYTSLGSYPDAEIISLIEVASLPTDARITPLHAQSLLVEPFVD